MKNRNRNIWKGYSTTVQSRTPIANCRRKRALKLLLLAAGILFAFLSPSESKAQGSYTNVYQYQAWVSKQTYAKKKRSYKRKTYKQKTYKRGSASGYSGPASLGGIVSQLQSKCGAKVISSLRPGSKTPFGVASCHSTGQAVDMTGNYACMFSVLRSWPGGYTTDPGRCKHIHISSCKMEWGMRFKHRTC